MLSEITGDLLCIVKRLRDINSDYRVFWNNRDMRYEVHTKALEFVVPYDVLDTRTLDYAMKTRKENAYAIEQEINRTNRETVQSAYKSLERATAGLTDMLEYANRASRRVTFTKNQIKEF